MFGECFRYINDLILAANGAINQSVLLKRNHATSDERGKTCTVTSNERGKTCNKLRTRENRQPVTNAGKHTTSAERGKTCKQRRTREDM